MVGWHHQLSQGHELVALGDGEGQLGMLQSNRSKGQTRLATEQPQSNCERTLALGPQCAERRWKFRKLILKITEQGAAKWKPVRTAGF